MRPRLGRDAAAEVDELLKRLILRKSLRHPSRTAAAEDDDVRADPLEACERLLHVRHLLIADRRQAPSPSASPAGTGSSPARRLRPRGFVRSASSNVGVRQRGDFRRAQLDVVESGGLRGGEVGQRRAEADLNPAGSEPCRGWPVPRRGRPRGGCASSSTADRVASRACAISCLACSRSWRP